MSSRKEQIAAYVEKMTDKERRVLLSFLKEREAAMSEAEPGGLPEKGAALVSGCMGRLLRVVWQHNGIVFAYEDAALSYSSHKPFDPRRVSAFCRKLPAGAPWGFFVGGFGSPQTLDGKDAQKVSDALALSFPPAVLARAHMKASHGGTGGKPDFAPEIIFPDNFAPELDLSENDFL